MFLREAFPEEKHYLYELGYQEWPKGRTLDQYIKDNQKEEAYGTRYVLTDEKNRISASLMMMKLRPYLFGIGSVVVLPEKRRQGLGTQLIHECMALKQTCPNTAFMLYSEIGTEYYNRFGFYALPASLQRFKQGTCMVKADSYTYSRILTEPIPDYF